jgi:hypothetical protein
VKRRATLPDSVMPPELAAGPGEDPAAFRPWLSACTAWSQSNGHGVGGWRLLLPQAVRDEYLPSALERCRRRAERGSTSRRPNNITNDRKAHQ